MNEGAEYGCVKERVDELMSGGPFNDGLGPSKTAREIKAEFGISYNADEIHAIWTQGKPWAPDFPQWSCCGNVVKNGHNELCSRARKD